MRSGIAPLDGCRTKHRAYEEILKVQPHLGFARQLDERIGDCTGHVDEPPVLGFIRTARMATGVTIRDLAERLGITFQAVHRMEAAERAGRISLNRFRDAAEALDCDLVVELVPRSTFQQMAGQRSRPRPRGPAGTYR